MKLLALLLLFGAAAVLAAPDAGAPPPPGPGGLSSSPPSGSQQPVSQPLGQISGQLGDVSTKVSQLSGGMADAASQLNKLAHVDYMLKEAARRRKLRWKEQFGHKPSQWSERNAKAEDQFGSWKGRQFPEKGTPEPNPGDNAKDNAADEKVDTKMLSDVIRQAKEASPLADSVNRQLEDDLQKMAASLSGYDKQVKKVNKKLEDATSTAAKKARKEAAMERIHTQLMESRNKIKELHQRAKQLSGIERQHKKNLRKKLKRLAQLHRQHVQKLIYQSRLRAMKIWIQHQRRQKLAKLMTNLKITQMYQQHKKQTQAAMSTSAKQLWKSFVKAIQGHKSLKDESRKALESINRLHHRRMALLKQDHQRKKRQIKDYVQQKYAAIMKKHYSDVADIRRKRQQTVKALSEEVNRSHWQKRRLERIVTDQESPDLTPDWEHDLRERAERTRRLHKLYSAIMEQKKLRLLKDKLEKRSTQIADKQGKYFENLRSKLSAKREKLTEVIASNQEKIDEAIRRERQRWRNRMARKMLKHQVSNLQEQLVSLKSGTAQDLPDDLRRSLEKDMARKHHEKLRQERRARRIANENNAAAPSFLETEFVPNDPSEAEAEPSALARTDDTVSEEDQEDEDGFAAELPALYNELRAMHQSGVVRLQKKSGKKHKSKHKKKHKKHKKKHHKKKKKHHKKHKKHKKKKHHKKKKGGHKKKHKFAQTILPAESSESSSEASEESGSWDPSEQLAAAEEAAKAESSEGGEEQEQPAEESTDYNDVSDLMNPEEEKLWRQFQATPDAVHVNPEDKGDKKDSSTKTTKGGRSQPELAQDQTGLSTSPQQGMSDAQEMLAEASGSDDDATAGVPSEAMPENAQPQA